MLERINRYLELMRFHKPIGILLLLWPTLWALWIAARGLPNLFVLFVFICGVILMRAAGCVINDFADRHFDGAVERTKNRPMVQGRVSEKEALILFTVLCALAFGLVLLMNTLTIQLAVVAAILAASYPFMKRFTHWPQLVLGLAFSWGIPMAFAAQTGKVPMIAWLLFFTAVLWTIAYDTQYAMVDRDDDLIIGIKSSAILFGRYDCIMIISIQIVVLLLLTLIGWILHLNIWYFLGLIITAGLLFYQSILIRDREKDRCFRAFLNNNWVGLVIFAGIFLSYTF